VTFDPEYVAARRVLLDALAALGDHRKAVVLVGAQAIYLRVGDAPQAELAVAPYTTDGDLAIDPRRLQNEPKLAEALQAARFELTVKPGTWTLAETDVQIDLLVPSALGGPGRRGARLGPHGNDVARKATGLEAAVVDHSILRVGALDLADDRIFDLAVAGLGALLVAKLHKLAERRGDESRLSGKDALDTLRILRHAEAAELASTLAKLGNDSTAGEVTRRARDHLSELFADRTSLGPVLAARATAGLADEKAIALSCEVLARELLALWQ
jgi:hypothetical protein